MNHRRLLIIFAAVGIMGLAWAFLGGGYKSTFDSLPIIGDEQQAEDLPVPATPAFDKAKHSLTDAVSPWVVVTKQRPLNPAQYAPNDLVNAGGGQQLRREAAAALQTMFDAAKAEGLTLQALS